MVVETMPKWIQMLVCLWHWVYHIRLEQGHAHGVTWSPCHRENGTVWNHHSGTQRGKWKPLAERLKFKHEQHKDHLGRQLAIRNGVLTGTVYIYIYNIHIHTYCTRSIYIHIVTWWPIHTFKHRQYPNCQHLCAPVWISNWHPPI